MAGEASENLKATALLLESMVAAGESWEPLDAERDRALGVVASLVRQIAEHGRVL
jgi:hypothetical protein